MAGLFAEIIVTWGIEKGFDFFHGGRVAGGGTGRQAGMSGVALGFGGGDGCGGMGAHEERVS